MPDVYIAVERHRCNPPGSRPLGSVWRCDICGHDLYVSDTDGCAPPSAAWTPVRWWNFRARRLIRMIDHG